MSFLVPSHIKKWNDANFFHCKKILVLRESCHYLYYYLSLKKKKDFDASRGDCKFHSFKS